MKNLMTLRDRVKPRSKLGLRRHAVASPDEDARVREAFNSIKAWVDARPNHILRSETEGRFVKTVSTSYYYMVGGELRYKVDGMTDLPNRGHMIFFKENNKFYAFFPETDGFVDATEIVTGYEGALFALHGILSFESILQGATLSRAIVEGEDGFELHLVFDAVRMGLNPPGEISLILRADNDGMLKEVEQERLGITQKTVMTYLTFDATEVTASLPVTPDPAATPPQGTFDAEAQKNLLYFRLLDNPGLAPGDASA
jgi:hypothetical protein